MEIIHASVALLILWSIGFPKQNPLASATYLSNTTHLNESVNVLISNLARFDKSGDPTLRKQILANDVLSNATSELVDGFETTAIDDDEQIRILQGGAKMLADIIHEAPCQAFCRNKRPKQQRFGLLTGVIQPFLDSAPQYFNDKAHMELGETQKAIHWSCNRLDESWRQSLGDTLKNGSGCLLYYRLLARVQNKICGFVGALYDAQKPAALSIEDGSQGTTFQMLDCANRFLLHCMKRCSSELPKQLRADIEVLLNNEVSRVNAAMVECVSRKLNLGDVSLHGVKNFANVASDRAIVLKSKLVQHKQLAPFLKCLEVCGESNALKSSYSGNCMVGYTYRSPGPDEANVRYIDTCADSSYGRIFGNDFIHNLAVVVLEE